MKKKIIALVLGIIATFGIVAYAARQYEIIQAQKIDYPVYIDSIPLDLLGEDIPRIFIDDTLYLPIRAIAEYLHADVEWNARKGTVYIDTHYGAAKDWLYEITAEKALAIEEIVFKESYEKAQGKSKAYILEETEDAYVIHRTHDRETPIAGGDLVVTISKKDGRILSSVGGE